jgi:hypothetical protein
MESGIKEYQLDLYADRTSTNTLRANQLRLWFASMAYVLLWALRRRHAASHSVFKGAWDPIQTAAWSNTYVANRTTLRS